MKSHRVPDVAKFLDPESSAWSRIEGQQISLMPTPLGMQPTEYIRRSWQDKPYGQVTALQTASVHDGHTWAIHASWNGVSPAGTDFSDALAVALPISGNPVLITMGGADAPIHFLRWAARKPTVHSVIATGIGQSRPGPNLKYSVREHADGDRWQVVIARPLGTGKDIAPLAAGTKTGVGFAVWLGRNDERAGIKAVSPNWTELVLDR